MIGSGLELSPLENSTQLVAYLSANGFAFSFIESNPEIHPFDALAGSDRDDHY